MLLSFDEGEKRKAELRKTVFKWNSLLRGLFQFRNLFLNLFNVSKRPFRTNENSKMFIVVKLESRIARNGVYGLASNFRYLIALVLKKLSLMLAQ